MGKCPEINHLKIKSKAIKKFIRIVRNLTIEEDLFLKEEIKDIGKLINSR